MYGMSGMNSGMSGISQNVSNYNTTVNNYFGNQIGCYSQGLSNSCNSILGNSIGGCSYQNYGYAGGSGSQSYNLGNSLGSFMGYGSSSSSGISNSNAVTWANMLSNYQIPGYTSSYSTITQMPTDSLYNSAMGMSGMSSNYGSSYGNYGNYSSYGSGYGSNYGSGYNTGYSSNYGSGYGSYGSNYGSGYSSGYNSGSMISNSNAVSWANMLSNYQIPGYTSSYSTITQMPSDSLYNTAMGMSGMSSSSSSSFYNNSNAVGWANFLGGWRS